MNPNWQAERITQSSLKLSNTSTFQTALKLQAPTSVMATLVRIAFSGSFYNNVDMLASHSLYKGGECSRSLRSALFSATDGSRRRKSSCGSGSECFTAEQNLGNACT
ncbi:hypothetical protein M419DRAFT_36660 [Trichoderma reesei RUT C-30]|uniref:Uncharacterized protein n=1 Tax=Hypocrea jecorina (strain ATCC 56765 / BCRC 32924 / NRRL 11460 / Rut C-30) TaxID=1344414 RepID=A0A024S944_HYPJR|nr:hypothetical protein M419DRAFT_36660 [Trichoderma reesei RUT C-30]